MKSIFKSLMLMLALVSFAVQSFAAYVETMDPQGLAQNTVTDYGMVDDAGQSHQSETMQRAIDKLAAAEGRLRLF